MVTGTAQSVGNGALDVVVTVHGIGDQVPGETVQHVVHRCSHHFGRPTGVSIGAIVSRLDGAPWATFDHLPGLGFAEVFWADIGRANEDHVLEETVSWARTITGRLAAVHLQATGTDRLPGVDLAAVERTIGDLGVLIRLAGIANRAATVAGVGSIDLDRVLTRFLGDVQLFAEFGTVRDGMVARFLGTMERIAAAAADHPGGVRIHVCAHSQGSALAFLGLLEGWRRRAPWLRHVHSLLTIGSPIDKFLILWPELWSGFFEHPAWRRADDAPRIRWHNYADRGDPVGYALDTARLFVERLDADLFEAKAPIDRVFSRYPVPGKAHVDYWHDQDLFDEWLRQGVRREAVVEQVGGERAAPARLVLTFGLPVATCLLTAHAFGQSLQALQPRMVLNAPLVFTVAALLFGSVAIGGAARTSRRARWWLLGVAAAAAGVAGLWRLRTPVAAWWAAALLLGTTLLPMVVHAVRTSATLRAAVRMAVLVLALVLMLLGTGIDARLNPAPGIAWLFAAALGWWFAALTWDLAVVWVDYVSAGRHLEFLERSLGVLGGDRAPTAPPAPPAASAPQPAPAPAPRKHMLRGPAGGQPAPALPPEAQAASPLWWQRRR